jgi:hypothetical protein
MPPASISPALTTLLAELIQQLSAAERSGAPYRRLRQGIEYIYAKEPVGAARRDIFLGRGDQPEVQAQAEALRRGATAAKQRRGLVRILKARGLWGPEPWLGRLLDAVAAAGLFEKGALLVGTAAYQMMEPLLGRFLPKPTLMTTDLDLATASLALEGVPGESFEQLLRLADPSFTALPQLYKGRPPWRFRSNDGHLVELLTPMLRRADRNPMPLPALAAGAAPLQYMKWLISEPVRAAALWGAGVMVTIPRPARYAVHKLIVAQRRDPANLLKRSKDLEQARIIIAALQTADPFALEDALEDAREQGREGWAVPISRSLTELGLDL